MKKACLVIHAPYANGAIFDQNNLELNRDNCLLFYHYLQNIFRSRGVDLNTHDINTPQECDYIIYNEIPNSLAAGSSASNSYLLLFESEIIKPDNWDRDFHRNFAKIFTWHDEFVDGNRYIKMNFTHDDYTNFVQLEKKTKFCAMIAGNKMVSHPLELYSERIKAINWFESEHPDKFDLYGVGWDMYHFGKFRMTRWLNQVPGLKAMRKMLVLDRPSYRGSVTSKILTFGQYKFSICYENAHGIPGYITEKIFDSMSANCIPIYWGAPNISDYVPSGCFIDKGKFASYAELYLYLVSMGEDEFKYRYEEIKKYLSSKAHEQFTPLYNANLVVDEVLGLI